MFPPLEVVGYCLASLRDLYQFEGIARQKQRLLNVWLFSEFVDEIPDSHVGIFEDAL